MFKRNLSLHSFKSSCGKKISWCRGGLKYFLVALLSPLLLFLFSCNGGNQPRQSTEAPREKIQVLSTTAMIGDLVMQIGGDMIDHTTLIYGEIDPHSYELVKGDDELFSVAQIVFCHGHNLEHGASLHEQVNAHPHVVRINEEIARSEPNRMIPLPEGGIDPHLWLDASLWSKAVEPIADHLSQALPEMEPQIRSNAKQVQEQILAMDAWMRERFGKIDPDKKYMVSAHDAFRYFARQYLAADDHNFAVRAVAPEGVAPEGQIGFQQIKEIVNFVMEHEIPYLFQESNLRADSLEKICSVCSHRGMQVKIFPNKLFADTTGSTPIGEGAYVAMLKNNAEALIKAWEPSLIAPSSN